MVFTHSGNIGDVLWSIPFMTHATKGERVADIYVKPKLYEHGDQVSAIEDLLLKQDCVRSVIPFVPPDNNWSDHYWPGLTMDYDLDAARWQRGRGYIYHIKRYFDTFNVPYNAPQNPWMKVDNMPYSHTAPHPKDYALICLSPRWNGEYVVDWTRVYQQIKERHKNFYFIGFTSECERFNRMYGEVEQLFTNNMLEVTRLIRDAEAVYCNQGPVLVISAGLSKEYYCAFNPGRSNCKSNLPNEHAL